MRTLIVSDMHLGQRPGHDVLRRPEPLARLLDALDGVDRLVLLGDVVELQSRLSGRRAIDAATPVLAAIGARVGPDREIVLVPGNHDAVMVRPWARARGAALGLSDEVPIDATPELAAVVSLLAPARVSVRYPGVWLGDGVWATHGHYLDRHLIPEATFGLPRGRLRTGRDPGDATPADYERARRRRRRRSNEGLWARARDRPLATALELVAEVTRYASGALRRAQLTGLTTRMIDLQMRHASVPAMARVSRRLRVDAEWVVFGHVHRLGPSDGTRWRPLRDGPELLNCGGWLYEPLLLDDASGENPYWPGGAVIVQDGEPPRAVALLGDLPRAALLGS